MTVSQPEVFEDVIADWAIPCDTSNWKCHNDLLAATWVERWLDCPDCGHVRGVLLVCETCKNYSTAHDAVIGCAGCGEYYPTADLIIHVEAL